ncbi:hypothetical protein DNHGIG_40010 [Collibacillus ludicampi]|uniref:Uncharacterized protein n=1 Tax=Collibacillus ludicampi TaxID=2771369 RepID=A0AAV4LKW3_9BACL|nr:peptidoglycan DD-metalloendopeptidase family protein [Collibacillus ludicampi]GIM48452.1 hypothetical protein DNHGIG_40010 [Collibacillus ludicampi]
MDGRWLYNQASALKKAGQRLIRKILVWILATFGPILLLFIMVSIIFGTFFGGISTGDYDADSSYNAQDENYAKPYKEETDKVNPPIISFNELERSYLLQWGLVYGIDTTGVNRNLELKIRKSHAKNIAEDLAPHFSYEDDTKTVTISCPDGTSTEVIPIKKLMKVDTYDGITTFRYDEREKVTFKSGECTVTIDQPKLTGMNYKQDFTRLDKAIKEYTNRKEVTEDDRSWVLQFAKGLDEKQENLDWLLEKRLFTPYLTGYIGEVPTYLIPIFQSAAKKYNVPFELLMAIAKQESTFNPEAVGPPFQENGQIIRCLGLMQIHPNTWAKFKVDGDGDGQINIFDAADNAFTGAHYLRYLIDEYHGDLHKVLYQYSGGSETYVNNVLGMADTFKKLLSAPASSSGYLWPVQGTSVHDITQYFGENGHRGLDIGAPEGTPILAPVSGVIKTIWTAAQDVNGGNSIVLHGVDGNDWYFAHLSAHKVHVGEIVGQGMIIGLVGQTGHATGPHLHLEFWANGNINDRRDPLPVLLGK